MLKEAVAQEEVILSLSGRGKLPQPMIRDEMCILERLLPILKYFDDQTNRVYFSCIYRASF